MEQYVSKAALVAEIERRLKVHMESNHGFSARYDELKDILSFLDTIEVKEVQEEPVSNDLEEAAKNVGKKYFPDESNIWARPNYEAKAAEYAFKDGANWQKEQMMKDAISTIMQRDDCNDLVPTIGDMSARGFEVGDKVKVIIIKE